MTSAPPPIREMVRRRLGPSTDASDEPDISVAFPGAEPSCLRRRVLLSPRWNRKSDPDRPGDVGGTLQHRLRAGRYIVAAPLTDCGSPVAAQGICSVAFFLLRV